ncbi:MAG: glycosyltransferase family 1 protein [Calditrichaeota bacterium]|nr:MAG: glycosyltransferase family 1 protein [Calditrichota bacterium]
MRKIALLSDHYPPRRGGFSRYVYELSRHWARLGWQVQVYTTVAGAAVPEGDVPGLQLIQLPPRANHYPGAFLRFARFIWQAYRQGTSLLFFPVWNPYAVYVPLLRRLTGRRFKIVIGTHAAEVLALFPGSSFPEKELFKALGRRALRIADCVFTISRFTADRLKALGVSASRISIFPNGVDGERFHPLPVDRQALFRRYNIPGKPELVLLTVAQLNPRKGIDTAIRAVRELKNRGLPVTYLVIGSGPDEARLRQMIQQLKLNDSVFLLPAVDDQGLLEFYNAADVFLLLSRQEGDLNVEGFGLVLLEAGACGVPVVAGRSGGIPDAVADGESGFLVDPLNVNEICRRLQGLLADPQLRRRMGEKGRTLAVSRFNWANICAAMGEQLEKLLTGR